MANKSLFSRNRPAAPAADAVNEAGGSAYRLPPKHALARLAATGTFHGTYYSGGEAQFAELTALCERIDDDAYLAKLAVYARERSLMKDMPVALLLILSRRDTELFHRAFGRVVTNGRTLRTFVQMLRSGRFGRSGLSYSLQRAVNRWLNAASVSALLTASVGHNPSLRDVLRVARPTPPGAARRALYGRLVGKPHSADDLPAEAKALDAFRAAESEGEQLAILAGHRFRWDLLADAVRGPRVWKAVARQMGTQALRMNLNTLLRHGVFDDAETVTWAAGRLSDADEVRRGGQFPYQYFAAYRGADAALPAAVRDALNAAAEAACGNVPAFPGPVVVGVDVSGSMGSPVTGRRGGGTSAVRCVDAAAVFAVAVARRNPGSLVVPFDHQVYDFGVSDGPILEVADRLSRVGGGGTDCSLPLSAANGPHAERRFAGCVLVSDSESWIGGRRYGETETLRRWEGFRANQRRLAGPDADPKLVCIDVQPYTTAQAPDRADVLNVGGFSDAVFSVVAAFLGDAYDRFVGEVEATNLD